MKNWLLLTLFVITLSAAMTFIADDSYAARMGGGRSFGSQPTMRQPTAAPRPAPTQQRQQPFNTPAPAAPRPSTGMMGGLFGGLLAGTLLGSLLGGGHAAGAGGGIGFIDIILFGILIWLGFKIFRKMRGNQNPATQDAYTQDSYQQSNYNYQDQGGAWDRMQGSTTGGGAWDRSGGISGFGGPQVPPGFDVDEFLQGAKAAYVRMQSSWDQRDLNDIALFATQSVLDVLRQDMRNDPNPSHTELININAQLMKVTDQGSIQRAEVLFDVVMREDPRQPTEQVKEIWHFMRDMPNGNWKLDGIQQTY